jgi:hypothetical protein
MLVDMIEAELDPRERWRSVGFWVSSRDEGLRLGVVGFH